MPVALKVFEKSASYLMSRHKRLAFKLTIIADPWDRRHPPCLASLTISQDCQYRLLFGLIFLFSSREVAMFRKGAQLFGGVALVALVILFAQPMQQTARAQAPAAKAEKHTAHKMTRAQKIALAMSAGPAEISKDAAIVDMTDMASNAPPKQLRA